MKTKFPTLALVIGVLADVIEVLATPVLGYFLAIPLEIYLYSWAKGYLLNNTPESAKDLHHKKLEMRKKIKSSLFFRIVLEYIPIVNLLPISTLFVLLAYRDRLALDKGEQITSDTTH